MIPDALENRMTIVKNKSVISDHFELKNLVQEIQETLFVDEIDYHLVQYFSSLNNRKFDPFGFIFQTEENLKTNHFIPRRNHLLHKLLRIQNEFKFVKNNIKKYQKLTCREREIIQLLAKGYNNPEIANRLFISRCTVEQHRKHINHKLHITSLPHLLQYSYAYNFI